MDTAILSCGWRCFSFGFAACMTSFDFWSNYIPHLLWRFPSADESTSKFAFFSHNTWSFLISFYLIIKKQFADINLQICLLAVSWFTIHITNLETEACRSLVTIALQGKSVFNRTQGAAFILIYISLYISLFFWQLWKLVQQSFCFLQKKKVSWII